MSWLCPLCKTPLMPEEKRLRCINQHHFDFAKEGYINLLPVQHKHSRDPGDNSAMIDARRTFLDAGHYQPLRDELVNVLTDSVKTPSPALLDLGCGEGYYTSAFAQFCVQRQGVCYGLDVSKVAIRRAAKRYPGIHFCVASGQRMPFTDASIDVITRIYAPSHMPELQRIVKPGGIVLTAAPAPRHLYELKELIYPDVRLHPISGEQLDGFSCEAQHSLNYVLHLSGEEAVALLQMTPFAWRARNEVWTHLASVDRFDCEADFVITCWRRD